MEKQILEQVAKEFNLPKKTINNVYSDWLSYIKDKISFGTEFDRYDNQLGFTFPYLGKIYVNKYKLEHINRKKNGRINFKKDSSKK